MPGSSGSRNEQKVLLLMRIVEINAPEHLRLCDHDAGTMSFKQPVVLAIAGQASTTSSIVPAFPPYVMRSLI
jgi:hypothetical protein